MLAGRLDETRREGRAAPAIEGERLDEAVRLEGVDEAVSHLARREAVDVPRAFQARRRGAVAEGPRVGGELRRRDGDLGPDPFRLGVRGVEVDRCGLGVRRIDVDRCGAPRHATHGMGAAAQRLGVHDQEEGATHRIDGSWLLYFRSAAHSTQSTHGEACSVAALREA